MSGVVLKILLSALPFFKEMIFGRKTKVEKITGIAMFLCFLIAILFVIIVNSFSYNLSLNKKNKTLMDEVVVMQNTIKTLENSKLMNICPDNKSLIASLESQLATVKEDLNKCVNNSTDGQKRMEEVKGVLKEME